MKIKNYVSSKSLILLFSILMSLIMIFSSLKITSVFADSSTILDDDTEISYGYDEIGFLDENLYNALVAFNNQIHPETTPNNVTIGCFKNFTGTIDLSNKNIENLYGLQFLKFDKLTGLNLSHNKIEFVDGAFVNMIVLENIDISYNSITSFDSTFSTKLSQINVSHNKITETNLSTCAENANIDLTFNELSNFDKINFPEVSANIYLTHNALTGDLPQELVCTLSMGFQGVLNNNIENGKTIKFYGLNNVSNIEIFKKDNSGEYASLATYTENADIAPFTIGYYKIVFNETVEPKVYADIELVCRPSTPTVVITNGEVETDKIPYKIGEVVKLKFSADSTIYVTVNGSQKKNINELDIKNRGTYTITYWQEQEGIESEHKVFTIISTYIPPMTFVWLVFGFLAFAGLFYLAIFLKNNIGNFKFNKKPKSNGRKFD